MSNLNEKIKQILDDSETTDWYGDWDNEVGVDVVNKDKAATEIEKLVLQSHIDLLIDLQREWWYLQKSKEINDRLVYLTNQLNQLKK